VTGLFLKDLIKLLKLTVFITAIISSVLLLSCSEPHKSVKLSPEEKTWLARNPEKLTLYFNIEFPPIEYASESGAFTGLGSDVINLVEKRLGVTFIKIPSSDWNRHLEALESGECAIAPVIVPTPERKEYALFTDPYAVVPVVIITSQSMTEEISLDRLRGRRVVVVSGYATEKYAREKSRGSFKVITAQNVAGGLRAVAFGQADAMMENLAVASYYIQKEGIPNLRVAGNTDYTFSWSIGVSRKYPLLYSAIQKTLDSIPEDEMSAVNKKWISLEVNFWSDPEIRSQLLTIAFFTILLMAGLAGISFILKRRLNDHIVKLNSAQREIKKSEEKFRAIFENAPYAIVINSLKDGSYLDVNRAFLENHGVTRDELSSLKSTGFSPMDKKEADKVTQRLLETGVVHNYETPFEKKDGSTGYISFSSALIEIEGEKQVLSMVIDITERKKAEEALREKIELLRATFNATPDGILVVDNDYRVSQANESFYKMWDIPPDLRESVDEKVMREFVTHQLTEPEKFRERVVKLYKSLASDTFEIQFTDGKLFECYSAPMLMEGNEVGRVWDFRDITERKQAEEAKSALNEQLLQSRKMEAVGVLAGGVAHDFNNMLGGIIGYTEITMNKMKPDDPLRKNLGRILDAAQRSANITKQLLAFARKQTVEPVVFDLNESVESMLKMIRRLIGENIELVWLPGSGSYMVRMDPSQFDQVLLNLSVNARDAINGIGRISIETDTVHFDKSYRVSDDNITPGEYVLLAVSDSGCGMSKEVMNHIFEPFFTTKGPGRGTGMGLATVYGAIRQNEGFISVYSEEGSGTTFKVYIPLYALEKPEPAHEGTEKIEQSRGETVLIVEDDQVMLEMSLMMLSDLGYNVITADTPGEALNIVKNNSSEIDLAITDVIMPEMNGRELAEQILSLRPGIKHIFMSGYTSDVIAHQGILDEGINFIQKPFMLRELAAKIRAVLDHS